MKSKHDHGQKTPGLWERVCDDLRAWIGTFRVLMTGGEAFLRIPVAWKETRK